MFKKINWQWFLGIAATLITVGIISLLTYIFGGWATVFTWLKHFWENRNKQVSIPVWLLNALVIVSLTSLLYFFIILIRTIITCRWKKLYKEVIFDEIVWRREYSGKKIINLIPYCPDDCTVLDYPTGRPRLDELADPTVTFKCKKCCKKWNFKETYKDIEEKICIQIHGNIRSGKWKQLVKKRVKSLSR